MRKPVIAVLAGTNGAGKSSIGGALFQQNGVPYFNPDEAAREIRAKRPGLALGEANSLAWNEGLRQLAFAIDNRCAFAFESTLGGRAITSELIRAAGSGFDARVWYVGLSSLGLHIARVQARVAKGGHPISEEDIRRRFDQSRLNLITLMPMLAELKVFDNSTEADPASGRLPEPKLLLHMKHGKRLAPDEASLQATPEWAKPLVMAALDLQ